MEGYNKEHKQHVIDKRKKSVLCVVFRVLIRALETLVFRNQNFFGFR